MGCQPLLPGQFLPVGEPPLSGFLEALRANNLKTPRPVSHKNTQLSTSLPPELMASEFVLVRKDGVFPPLAQPYSGPYRVLRRSLYSFQLQVGDRTEEISTHRLKVCRAPADTSCMQIVLAWPPVTGKFPSILFTLHATGGHAGTICIQLAATRIHFECDWPPVASYFCMQLAASIYTII
jgi:hypothetical protein